MVMSTLEDTPAEKVVWMPAHKSKQAAGQFRCSNGELITESDIKGNAEADRLAKLAVMQHRVDRSEVKHVGAAVQGDARHGEVDRQGHVGCQQLRRSPLPRHRGQPVEGRSLQEGGQGEESGDESGSDDQEQDAEDREQDMRGHNPVKVLQLSGIRSGWRCTCAGRCRPRRSS